ncbi:hypothetical protein ACFQL9_13380 [Halobaculum lipolyticum]|uniref:Uncharacterized protein n=1 Tax=Halobaculum lipolyticum TaxID=3032001 RepID=A0ABD5WES4_9EURY
MVSLIAGTSGPFLDVEYLPDRDPLLGDAVDVDGVARAAEHDAATPHPRVVDDGIALVRVGGRMFGAHREPLVPDDAHAVGGRAADGASAAVIRNRCLSVGAGFSARD